MQPQQRPIAGRYEFLELLGSGGMAAVYRAVDERLGRDVAVKMLLPAYASDEEFVERFRREARAAAGINHPNVVAVYDWGRDGDAYYMVMEYVPGQTLKQSVLQRGPMNEREALDIARQVAAGLQAAHERGVVHRDVKPQNILLGPGGRVKIADFGIAHAAGATQLTSTNAVNGTATYMSPEQAQLHGVGPRSDVYSLGVVLYEMLTGAPPFTEGSMVDIALQHVHAPIPDIRAARPDLHTGTVRAIDRALAKNPLDRYRDAGAFASALEDALLAVTTPPRLHTAPPTEQPTAEVRPRSTATPVHVGMGASHDRRAIWWPVLAVPLLIAVGAGGLVLSELHRTPVHHGASRSSTATTVPVSGPHATASPRPSTATATRTRVPSRTSVAATHPTAVPTRTPTPPRASSTPVQVAETAPLDPQQTVLTFYTDVAQHEFGAATDLWTAAMRSRCDPATCINVRFAPTTSVHVNTHLESPPANGQAVVGVNLMETRTDGRQHWLGTWHLVEQDGRWLMDSETFCRPGVDAGCS